jgi:prophage antirepressor-like protein
MSNIGNHESNKEGTKNALAVFDYESHKVRTVFIGGESWWVLKDVCDVLEINNSRMVAERLCDDELMSVKLTSGGQEREMNVVSESGLYNVIFRSNKPEALTFRKWVTHEVLPSIHGQTTKIKRESAANDLQLFNNAEFGEVRTAVINGKPYAVGVDVARALDYERPSQAITDNCKGIRKLRIPSGGGKQETNMIPEGDIYRLIIKAADQSRNSAIKAKAERFERWLFDEILPSIRKHGAYITREKLEEIKSDPDSWTTLLSALDDEREARQKAELLIETQKPKVDFYDAVADCRDDIDMGAAAKLLGLGRNRLFKFLRLSGVLMENNVPYQKYMDLGCFRVIEQKYLSNDEVMINFKTLVLQKGLDLISRICAGSKQQSRVGTEVPLLTSFSTTTI